MDNQNTENMFTDDVVTDNQTTVESPGVVTGEQAAEPVLTITGPDGNPVKLNAEQVKAIYNEAISNRGNAERLASLIKQYEEYNREFEETLKSLKSLGQYEQPSQQQPQLSQQPTFDINTYIGKLQAIERDLGIMRTEQIVRDFASAYNLSMDDAINVVRYCTERNIPSLEDGYKAMQYEKLKSEMERNRSKITPPSTQKPVFSKEEEDEFNKLFFPQNRGF